MKSQEIAIISIQNGTCHLDYTFNYNASNPIQIERYDENGWNAPQNIFADMTDRQFWNYWGDWNGRMCGCIYLDDGNTPEQINSFIHSYGALRTVAQIPDLPDGAYAVMA